jgi:hypothetical protein
MISPRSLFESRVMAKWALIILGFAAGIAVAQTAPQPSQTHATMGVSVIVVDPKTPPPKPDGK